LLGEGTAGGTGDRKQWIELRLKELDSIFAISVGGFSVMDNHLHLLLRIDPEVASGWTDAEVVERWHRLYPPRGSDRKPLPPSKRKELVEKLLADAKWLQVTRQRLCSLGWFMKCLKEPLSRLVNKAEKCTGAFFEGRYKSIAIVDEEALLAVCAYIDLNPVAAGIATKPEECPHTSCKARVDHVHKLGRESDVQKAEEGSVQASQVSSGLEEQLWLVPIEDRRLLDSQREGMLETFTLGNYLKLVDYTGRLMREGKAAIGTELDEILTRIGSTADQWKRRMQRLSGGRLLGRFACGSRKRLRELAGQLGVSRLADLSAAAGG